MERKERILRKALKLYGVADEEQNSFVEDLARLDSEEPDEEEEKVEDVASVEDEKLEEVEETPAEEKGEEVEEVEEIEKVDEEEPKSEEVEVDYGSQLNELKETIQALQGQVSKLYEICTAQGKDVEEFGNVQVEGNKVEDYEGDQYLRDRLNGKR